MSFVFLASPRRAVAGFLQTPPRGDALALASEFSSGILRLMKVNLLPGTYTPTLTPMPGVHQALQPTASSVRSFLAPAFGSSSCLALAASQNNTDQMLKM